MKKLLIGFLMVPALAARADELDEIFAHPPESAKPGALWMWMGCNLSSNGITRDLEALKEAGFNRTTMFSLADVTTPWAGEIGNSPTPEIVSWTEPWWKLVRHAALESKRLGMDFGMFNGPSYESSGGPWVTADLSMQEVCFSQIPVNGPGKVALDLPQPTVDPRAVQAYPVFNPNTGQVEKPEIPERKTYYRDIAVLAMPATGVVAKDQVIDLTGKTEWDAPAGNWIVYRFGHTTMGSLIQPAQWKATGFECDKMSVEAVTFHMNHVIGEIQKHLGDLIGTGFTHVHFDSYEAGTPGWTPKMREEFSKRRGYELTPFLAIFAGRVIGGDAETKKFRGDFHDTILDLYRDVYFTTVQQMLRAAKLEFLCEPYGGPWRQDEIMPKVDRVMTEFWTTDGRYEPYEVDPTIAALRKSGQNIVEAEAFTGGPADSQWTETPAWAKPIGDAAYCAGINGTTRNGSGGDETLNDGKTFRGYGAGSSLTLRLAEPSDLAGIRTFAGHPDGRASQSYTVLIARATDPATFEKLASASVRCGGGASELRVKAGATDVVAVRFEFQDGPLDFNVYREINLVGATK